MSVTLSITDSLRYVSTMLDNQTLSVNELDPGITVANIVLQRILGAPFIWRFNRATLTVPIGTGAGTDVTVSCTDLGRIETQWLTDANNKIFELKGSQSIPKKGNAVPGRPTEVAPVYDDNEGNITFRFNMIAEAPYTAFFDYQRKAPLLGSYGATFAPVPDEFGYVFNAGMLAGCALLTNDSRFPIYERDFVTRLLATQDGLDAQDIQIFLGQALGAGRTAQRSQDMGKLGSQARSI